MLRFCGSALAVTLLLAAQVSERVRQVHQRAFVFDAHMHASGRQFYLGGDIGDRRPDGQFDLPRARDGGVDALFFSVFVPEPYYPQRFETKQALRVIEFALEQIDKNRDSIELALKASDIERINRRGKIAAVLDLEGPFDLDGDLGVLRSLYRLGLRSAQVSAHNWTSQFADSCCAPAKWGGLNERGRAVIREMNRLGMVINVSHASDEAIEQAIEASAGPVVATHHGLRSVNDIPRNLPDRLLKKLAAKGGVMGFQIGCDFHSPKLTAWREQKAASLRNASAPRPGAPATLAEIDREVARTYREYFGLATPEELRLTVDEWVAVVDRAIQLAGEDAVALGSDFDGGPAPPRGIRDAGDLALITDAMLRRGYSEARIAKFLGGNLLRVFREVTEKQ
jgi:membrane dipeptidase